MAIKTGDKATYNGKSYVVWQDGKRKFIRAGGSERDVKSVDHGTWTDYALVTPADKILCTLPESVRGRLEALTREIAVTDDRDVYRHFTSKMGGYLLALRDAGIIDRRAHFNLLGWMLGD